MLDRCDFPDTATGCRVSSGAGNSSGSRRARGLVIRPRVLLMDEPFGALDRALRETMRVELRALHRALGITVILVIHDQDGAMDLSDRVAVMRAGRLRQVAAPRVLYDRPADASSSCFGPMRRRSTSRATRRRTRSWAPSRT